jgi:hypothetical protein
LNTETVISLNAAAGSDQRVSELAASLKRVVELSNNARRYEDLFLRHKEAERSHFHHAENEIAMLLTAGLMTGNEKRLKSNLMLHVDPHKGLIQNLQPPTGPVLIATDWPDVSLDQQEPFDGREMVFPLHYESFALLEGLASHLENRSFPPGPVLDMFCGSGVLGIYAAHLGLGPIWFSDTSARALAFARLNAHLNSINPAAIVQSDMFKKLPRRQQWQWILANPPFEAVPETSKNKYFIHSYGGHSGQEQMMQFLKEAPQRLTDTGRIFAVDFILDGQGDKWRTSLERDLQHWLRESYDYYGRLIAFDQIELRDFWLRYEFLGIDPRRDYLRRKLHEGISSLLLCTLEVSRDLSRHQVRSRQEMRQSDTPGPCVAFWQNPLQWPLPCGITLDEDNLKHWRSMTHEWEREKLADEAAILAEAMGSFEEKVSYWDFSEALDRENPRFSETNNRMVRGALVATLNDAERLLLAGVMHPRQVSLFILPPSRAEKISPNAKVFEIRSPRQRQPWKESRETFFRHTAQEHIGSKPYETFQNGLSKLMESEHTLVFRFAIREPRKRQTDIRQLPDLQEYKELAEHKMVWGGPFKNGQRPVVALLEPGQSEEQAYLLHIDLGEEGLSRLRAAELVWGPGWLKELEEQCFRFMRDRLTLLAIPMIVAQKRAAAVSNQTLKNLREIIEHDFSGTSATIRDQLNKLSEQEQPLTRASVNDIASRLTFMKSVLKSIDCLMAWDPGNERKEQFGDVVNDLCGLIREWVDVALDGVHWVDDSSVKRVHVHGSFRFVFAELLRNAYNNSPSQSKKLIKVSGRREGNLLLVEVNNQTDIVKTRTLQQSWEQAKKRFGQSLGDSSHIGLDALLLVASRWGTIDYHILRAGTEINAVVQIHLDGNGNMI